jgi:hypothetical protein
VLGAGYGHACEEATKDKHQRYGVGRDGVVISPLPLETWGRVGQEVSDFLDDLAARGAERHWDGREEQAARRQRWLQDLGADLLRCQALAVRSALQRVREAATCWC